MTFRDRVETKECPFLRPGLAAGRRAGLTAAIYCALTGGRVKLPERDEMERFCVAGNFTSCPTYQRHVTR